MGCNLRRCKSGIQHRPATLASAREQQRRRSTGRARERQPPRCLGGSYLESQDQFLDSLALSNSYRDIAQRLADLDPKNAGLQRDLSISHGRVARVVAQQEDTARALGGFREGRAIIARLVAASPGHATLPRDLAWFDAAIAGLEKGLR